MKYILYRSLGSIDKDVKKHEIVGVEFGDSIDDVADDLTVTLLMIWQHCRNMRMQDCCLCT